MLTEQMQRAAAIFLEGLAARLEDWASGANPVARKYREVDERWYAKECRRHAEELRCLGGPRASE